MKKEELDEFRKRRDLLDDIFRIRHTAGANLTFGFCKLPDSERYKYRIIVMHNKLKLLTNIKYFADSKFVDNDKTILTMDKNGNTKYLMDEWFNEDGNYYCGYDTINIVLNNLPYIKDSVLEKAYERIC